TTPLPPVPPGLVPEGFAGGGLRGTWPVVLLFPALALWPLLRPRPGAGHRAHHLLEGATMGWMVHLWLLGGGHAAPAAGPPAVVGTLSAAYFAGYALRTGFRLVPSGPAPAPGPGRPPEMAAACRIVTAVSMTIMLVGM
ncbi:DUF5134 domain-containing protein, partial [Streptomyces alkaliphilus]|uniref:DUF5134 domain-containing protein n=1 Tax=Streptomyces alkaliphilus TaxID=1472722 RepID=UPI001297E8E1